MPKLLLAEHDNASLKDATNKALTAAKQLGGEVHILVAGQNCKPVAEAAAKLDGVGKVLLADAPAYQHMLAEPTAALMVALAEPYDTLMAPATTTGKNIMPRVAALLDVMQISDIIKVVAPDTFERPIYAGNAVQTVRSPEKKRVITVRTAAFQATGAGGSAPINWRIACGGRCRLCAERLAGRANRQGGGPGPLYRGRHFRRHPTSRRHEGLESDRGDQQR